ncbi:hypothetical protein H6F89_08745 [Cyanobacteria bacterium FACHB-63]|nr:hypothetical protein [Cyanobacteria bacterium FACHB-63]
MILTRLLSLLDGGQKQSWLKLLKSDLETIAILFLLALSFATAVALSTPEPPAPDAQRIHS